MSDSYRLLAVLLIFCARSLFPASGTADEKSGSDLRALSHLFNEEHVEDIAFDLRTKAGLLDPAERYAFLRKWLLPNETHNTWRLPFAFLPTDPSPPGRASLGITSNGGELFSPVYDLIDVAHQLNRLDQLEAEIGQFETDGDRKAQKAQLALLTLIAIEKQDAALIEQRLWAFLALTLADAELAPSPAEWLVISKCIDIETLRPQIAECVFKYLTWTHDPHTRDCRRRHWSRPITLLRPTIEDRDANDDVASHIPAASQWNSFANSTSVTNGVGCPPAEWVIRPGFVENISSHNEDFLYFAVPMRGDYVVECELSGSGWLDSQVCIAGNWVAPTYERDALLIGSFLRKPTSNKLPFQLTNWAASKWKGWAHYRAVVSHETVQHFINGRLVFEDRLSADSNPWLAIRSSFWRAGAVRNFTITGTPVVPDSIALLANRRLDDWVGYYSESVGNRHGDWWLEEDELRASNHQTSIPAFGHTESLLRYHRPLFDDGSIEYEFYYEPDKHEVHPAIGRMVIMLDPAGVKLHWLTDGREDRTGLAPDNISDPAQNRLAESEIPLRANDWNHLALNLKGDLLTVAVNGTPIFEHPLDRDNPRTFGLFHYSDRTGVRVRKMIHRGDWPRRIPELADQRLASDEVRRLDRNVEHMQASFFHRFGINDQWETKFALPPGTVRASLTATENGLKTYREAKASFQDVTLVANLKVHGDFDLIAEYADFSATPVVGGHATANLLIRLENDSSDTFFVLRKHLIDASGKESQIGSCALVREVLPRKEYKYFGSTAMEETAGKLRLSRRGTQLYYLTAENDSEFFQLRGQREIARDDIREDGIRLWSQVAKPGTISSVTWKSLTVRAEELSGTAIE